MNNFLLHIQPTYAGVKEDDIDLAFFEHLARALAPGLMMMHGELLSKFGSQTQVMVDTGISSNIMARPFRDNGGHRSLGSRTYCSRTLAPPALPGALPHTRSDWNVVR
jgi:hypothetical protein